MKKINILFPIIMCTLALSSCEKFLDVKPTNSGDATVAVTTARDAEVIINGLMSRMTSSSYYGRNFLLYADAKGGDLAIASQGRGSDALYVFNHSASSNSYSGFWSQMYNCIRQINSLLENIDNIEKEGTDDDFSRYKGQALTARAMIYFDLVRLYGKPYNFDKTALGVPKITSVLAYNDQPTRASVEEIYALILEDLKAGAEFLTDYKDPEEGYLNYYANKAIQARVYLYMENYDAALAAAEEIIKSGEYKLYGNDEWVNSWRKQFGSESIFELAMYDNEGDLGTSSLGFYYMKIRARSNALGWFMASNYFLERLGEDETDVRWGVMDDDELSGNDVFPDGRKGSCYKYVGGLDGWSGSNAILPGDGKASYTAVNIKVIRLSEIYLIAAEAALNSSTPDKAKAAGYLQEIRKRAPGLEAATASNITMQMIMDERSKELFGEGQRFFDMMRWNQSITFNDDLIVPAVQIVHRDKTIDRTFYKTILPIPQDEMDANPAIANQQNPGY